MSFSDGSMAADCVVLVRDPDYQDDVERSRRVVEELRHYRLHTCKEGIWLDLVF